MTKVETLLATVNKRRFEGHLMNLEQQNQVIALLENWKYRFEQLQNHEAVGIEDLVAKEALRADPANPVMIDYDET